MHSEDIFPVMPFYQFDAQLMRFITHHLFPTILLDVNMGMDGDKRAAREVTDL